MRTDGHGPAEPGARTRAALAGGGAPRRSPTTTPAAPTPASAPTPAEARTPTPTPTPKARPTVVEDPVGPDEMPDLSRTAITAGGDLLTRGFSVLLTACLLAAPLALGLVTWQALRPEPSVLTSTIVAGDPQGDDTPPVALAGFAAATVRSWLESGPDEEPATGVWATLPPASRPDGALAVSEATTVAVTADGDDGWVVTVLARTDSGPLHLALRVSGTDTGFTVDGLPWVVPEPTAAWRDPSVSAPPLPSSHPARLLTEEFLVGYHTGQDVQRWTVPGGSISSPVGAPVESVDVVVVDVTDRAWSGLPPEVPRDGDRVDVEASVRLALSAPEAESARARTVLVTYPLTLAGRDGRWEVARLAGSADGMPTASPEEGTSP